MKAAYICWICLVIGLPFSMGGSIAGSKNKKQDLSSVVDYIQKVQFLEAQNRKLVSEMDALKSKWGKETSVIKGMYETELGEARRVLDETTKEKTGLEVRLQSLTAQHTTLLKQVADAKKWRSEDLKTINKRNQQVADLESEVSMLRRSNEALEGERERDKHIISGLNEELENLRVELEQETTQTLNAENRAQTLIEEMEFLKRVHEQELKELSALAGRDTTEEHWNEKIAMAIESIQKEYDSQIGTMRQELEKCGIARS